MDKIKRKRISKIGSKNYAMCPNCGNIVIVGEIEYLEVFYCKECKKNIRVVDND